MLKKKSTAKCIYFFLVSPTSKTIGKTIWCELTYRQSLTTWLAANTHTYENTQRRKVKLYGYLVVPHADIGPNVIVDDRLLLVFRLRTHMVISESKNIENNLCSATVGEPMLHNAASATHWVHTVCSVFTQNNHYKRVMFLEQHVHGWAVNVAASLNIISGITAWISK